MAFSVSMSENLYEVEPNFYENEVRNQKDQLAYLSRRTAPMTVSQKERESKKKPHRLWSQKKLVYLILYPLLHPKEINSTSNNMNVFQWRMSNAVQWASCRRVCRLWRDIFDDFDLSFGENFSIKMALQKGKAGSVRYIAYKTNAMDILQDPTKLLDACRFGHVSLVKLLLKVEGCDPNSHRPLSQACRKYHFAIVKMFLDDPRISPQDYFEDFKYAAEHNQREIIEIFLKDGRLDPNQEDCISLQLAVQNECLDATEALLQDERVNPLSFDPPYRLLLEAMNHSQIFELLTKRIEPTMEVVLQAIERNNIEILKIIVNNFTFTPSEKSQALKAAKRSLRLSNSQSMTETLKLMKTDSKMKVQKHTLKSNSCDGNLSPSRGNSRLDVSVRPLRSESEQNITQFSRKNSTSSMNSKSSGGTKKEKDKGNCIIS